MFFWNLLPEYTTCLGWMAAVVLPSSPDELARKQSPNRYNRLTVSRCRATGRGRGKDSKDLLTRARGKDRLASCDKQVQPTEDIIGRAGVGKNLIERCQLMSLLYICTIIYTTPFLFPFCVWIDFDPKWSKRIEVLWKWIHIACNVR